MTGIQTYSYLWDGTEAGWCLSKLEDEYEITISFSTGGATLKDVSKLRKFSSELGKRSSSELLSEFKGREKICFSNLSELHLEKYDRKAEKLGLNISVIKMPPRYVIINEIENTIMTIEDNNIYNQVQEKMIVKGVKVIAP